MLVLFVVYRAQLHNAEAKEFEGGEVEHSRLVQETEHDYVALASAGPRRHAQRRRSNAPTGKQPNVKSTSRRS